MGKLEVYMRINSYLLAVLIAGQVMPAMAMQRNILSSMRFHVQAAAHIIKTRPFLVLGIAALELAVLGGVGLLDSLWHHYRIGYKIDCWRGKYSLESQLLTAAWNNDAAMVEKLLNRGADPNVNAHSCSALLRTAIQKNNETMLDLVLKAGANPNAQQFLFTVLCQNRFNKAIAKKLIEAGADPDMPLQDGTGRTVREYAQAKAAQTSNQDYINVFKPETKLL